MVRRRTGTQHNLKFAEIPEFDFFARPRGFAQKGEAGFHGGIELETANGDAPAQLKPAMPLDQRVKYGFQRDPVQRIERMDSGCSAGFPTGIRSGRIAGRSGFCRQSGHGLKIFLECFHAVSGFFQRGDAKRGGFGPAQGGGDGGAGVHGGGADLDLIFPRRSPARGVDDKLDFLVF